MEQEYKTCFFCNKNPANENHAVEVKMRKRGQEQFTEIWLGERDMVELPIYPVAIVKVPRCEDCNSAHNLVRNCIGTGLVLGVLVGILEYMTIIRASGDGVFLGLTVWFATILVGAFAGQAIGRTQIPKDIRPFKDCEKFGPIRELQEQGFILDETPTM